MAGVERKLGQVESALSGRDRARLIVQAINRGEDTDERLLRYCPASERAEMTRVLEAVDKGVSEIWQRLPFEIEWLNSDDISLGWLECIAGFLAREKALKKLAGAQAKSVPAMPRPGRGFLRDVPLFWGVPVDPPDHGPFSWEEAVTFLSAELRRRVEIRWRYLRAYEDGLSAASRALGITIAHPDITKAMEVVRAKVLELHAALQAFEQFELPGPTEAEREMVAGFWDMEVLREEDEAANARAMMFRSKRAELETWEAEQAEKLREGR